VRPGGCEVLPSLVRDAPPGPVLAVTRKTLPNGLRVVLAENHAVPLVWLCWICRGGAAWDPPELAGMAALTAPLLREGTARRSADRITEEADDLGADLVAGGDWDSGFLSIQLLADDLAAGAELLLDMACSARFPEAAVARLRGRRLAELERRRRQPKALADDAFARLLYGDAAYGRPLLGTTEGLQRIAAADLAVFHACHYGPATSWLVLVGSFETETAAALLGALELPPAARWREPLPAPPVPAAAPVAGVRVIDLPRAAQTEIRVGHAGVPRDSPDLPALQVLNAVLGDGPASRLTCSLRQRQGLTYHVGSRFAARHGGGPFVVATSVGNDGVAAALAGITQEIARLREQPVPEAELGQAKVRLLGAEIRRFQSIHGTGLALNHAAFEEEPVRYFDRFRQAIAAVEPDRLQELARGHLHPDRLAAVAVGPAEALRSQLLAHGEATWMGEPIS
jgi:zinc protease